MSTAPAEYGEIFDRGYLHYDGPRLGQTHTVWALARYSIARSLGFRRPWTAKIIPMLLYAAVAIPVAIAIGIRAFVPGIEFLDYPALFGAIFLLVGIFVALIAPEMMSSDRHDRLLPLYFSRPVGRGAYVLAKLLGAGLLTLSMSLLPAAVLWLGNGLLAPEPLPAMRDSLDDLGRIVVAGTLIAFYLGAIGLMIASFTGRRSVAVGVIILGFALSESLSFAISEALRDQPDLVRWSFVLSPLRTVMALVGKLFMEPELDSDVSLNAAIGVMMAVIVVCSLVMFAWYQRHD
ncbi:MAG: ABC transporter permease subunit [Chloroflexia bacterium]|nr:ABC transporter permease subunit [Chloroflexia bacterium]